MNMVIILLMFIHTERSCDWHMHKSAFLAMLPWLAHYDHTNYMRWGTVYATDVNQLEFLTQMCTDSSWMETFFVKSTHKAFNQISTDLALE